MLAGGGSHSKAVNPKLLRCNCKLGNCACECKTATNGDTFKYRTARKGEKSNNQGRGQSGR
eukprot:6210444-Pleurochrysis_carterae.AAC.3